MTTPCLQVAACKGPYASLDTAVSAAPSDCSCVNALQSATPEQSSWTVSKDGAISFATCNRRGQRLAGVRRPSGEAINTPRRSYPKPQTPAVPYDTSKVMLLHVPPKSKRRTYCLPS